MTFYCCTNECLRDYILRYFGEYGSNYCGNCANCRKEFETAEVTEAARIMIGCVKACGQRYGINVILDTVRGAETEKLASTGGRKIPVLEVFPECRHTGCARS